MKRPLFAFAASLLVGTAVVYGCGDDTITLAPKPDGGAAAVFGDGALFTPVLDASADGGPDADADAAPVDAGPSGPPVLGVQIGRFGRPAIETTLVDPFDVDASAQGSAEDQYNANADRSTWDQYVPELAKNLAVYDGLDQICGNDALADHDAGDGNVQRYGALATVLADDRQWLDTSQATCTRYLAVELAALSKTAPTDCGGRALAYDVIDVTYNVAAAGPTSTALTDGVGKSAAKTGGTVFPFLAAP